MRSCLSKGTGVSCSVRCGNFSRDVVVVFGDQLQSKCLLFLVSFNYIDL